MSQPSASDGDRRQNVFEVPPSRDCIESFAQDNQFTHFPRIGSQVPASSDVLGPIQDEGLQHTEGSDESDNEDVAMTDTDMQGDTNLATKKIRHSTTFRPDAYLYKHGLSRKLEPMHDTYEIFLNISKTMLKNGLTTALLRLNGRELRIGTMCSGTESPVLGFMMIQKVLGDLGYLFRIKHVFSAEIVPYKQYYIDRNFKPDVLFRNILDLSGGNSHAATAQGGIAEIPGDLDLLVAGFACVDFSSLNGHKKSLADRGESGDTFSAIVQYCIEKRPLVIILENVKHAPWDMRIVARRNRNKKYREKSLSEWLEIAGYAAQWRLLDTKAYYLPQTRQRGYLVAIDKQRLPDEEAVNERLQLFVHILDQARRPASSPAIAFMRRDLGTDFVSNASNSRHNLEDPKGNTQPLWLRCAQNHANYRIALGLGKEHPLTRWLPGGAHSLPNFYSDTGKLTERMLDSLDVAHLRNIQRGMDDRYYSRMLELSQSVFRVQDVTRDSIVGCQMPCGHTHSSFLGRKLTGQATLALQGIPTDMVHNLSELTDSQIRDMAGNAMSTPVVTIAMLAGLIAAAPLLQCGKGLTASLSQIMSHPQEVVPIQQPNALALTASACNVAALELFCTAARETCSRCFCEKNGKAAPRGLAVCVFCRHFACQECMSRPSHYYVAFRPDANLSRNPYRFESLVRSSLPMKLSFDGIFKSALQMLHNQLSTSQQCGVDVEMMDQDEDTTEHAQRLDVDRERNAIELLLSSFDDPLYFVGSRRLDRWELTWQSTRTNLVLNIDDYGLEWLLYLIPPPGTSNRSFLRYLDDHAILRKRPTGPTVLDGGWEYFVPEIRDIAISITSFGPLVPTYANTCGIPTEKNKLRYTHNAIEYADPSEQGFCVRDISGVYVLGRNCAQAFDTEHIRVSKDEGSQVKPLYFYFRHDHAMGDHEYHSYVVTEENRRPEWDTPLSTIAKIDPSWQPPQPTGQSVTTRTMARTYGSWKPIIGDFEYDDHSVIVIQAITADFPQVAKSCRSALTILEYEIQNFSLKKVDPLEPARGWTALKMVDREIVFKQWRWAINHGLQIPGFLEADTIWRRVDMVNFAPNLCLCAPKKPKVLFEVYQHKNGTKPYVSAVEHSAESTDAARALTAAGSVYTIYHRQNDRHHRVRFTVAPTMIAHKANQLIHHRMSHDLYENQLSQVLSDWLLVTDHGSSVVGKKTSFKLERKREIYEEIILPECCNLTLKPLQHQAVAWILRMESQPQPFIEEEILEKIVPEVHHRLCGRARQQVLIRGGVLAQDVGFGKTVLIISAILASLEKDEVKASEPIHGQFASRATVAYCPPHLVDQWVSEVVKFVPTWREGVEIIGIVDFNKLLQCTIDDLVQARVVVVGWKLFESPAYLKTLAKAAGMMNPPTSGSVRTHKLWYERAIAGLAQGVEVLKSDPKSYFVRLHDKYNETRKTNKAMTEPKTSDKRLKGQAYQESKRTRQDQPQQKVAETNKEQVTQRSEQSTKKVQLRSQYLALDSLSAKKMKGPPLEMIRFARGVLDEFDYPSGFIVEALGIMLSRSQARWILSATPRLNTFEDIHRIAQFLGVNLGRVEYSRNRSEAKKQMASSEEFSSYVSPKSATWHANRNIIAQRFVRHYIRKDFVTKLNVNHRQIIMLCDVPPAEKCMYLEMQAWVGLHDLRPFSSPSHGLQQQRELNKLLEGTQDGVRALISLSSTFAIDANERSINLKDLPRGKESKKWPAEVLNDFLDKMLATWEQKSQPDWVAILEELNRFKSLERPLQKVDLTTKWSQVKNKVQQAEKSGYRYHNAVNKPPKNALEACLMLRDLRRRELDMYMRHVFNVCHTAELVTHKEGCLFPGWEEFHLKTLTSTKKRPEMLYMLRIAHQQYNIANWLFYWRMELAPADCKAMGLGPKVVDDFIKKLPKGNPAYPRIQTMTKQKNHPDRTDREQKIRDALYQVIFAEEPLMRATNSLAFAEFALLMVSHSYHREQLVCGICNQIRSRPQQFFYLSRCGHTSCSACLGGRTICPICRDGSQNEHEIFQGSEFEVRDEQKFVSHAIYGQKIEDVVDLIDNKIPPLDQVLCFTDGPNAAARLALRLKARGISATNLAAEGNNSSRALQDFLGKRHKPKSTRSWRALQVIDRQGIHEEVVETSIMEEADAVQYPGGVTLRVNDMDSSLHPRIRPEPDWPIDKDSQSRVLILNMSDETAAGSNLTCANHMIFLGPYYTAGPAAQIFWEAAITQSTGRCLRYGQEKEVKSYFFLNRHTTEVDIFEKRMKKIIPASCLQSGQCDFEDLLPRETMNTECGSLIDRLVRREK